METRRLIRLSAVALASAGALYLPPAVLGSWRSIVDIGGLSWWIVHAGLAAHHVVLVFGIFGLFAAQLRAARILAPAWLVLVGLGNALIGGVRLVELTVLPPLTGDPATEQMINCTPFFPPATQSAQAFVDLACEPWDFSLLATLSSVAWLGLMLGTVMLGLAIVAARVLPAFCGVLVCAGAIASLAAFVFPAAPELLNDFSYAAIGGGYLWSGIDLFRRRQAL